MIIESPLDLIFRDLFYRLRNFAGSHDVFLKLEGFNVTGSIKIKTAIGLVEDLERRGIAKPNETVIVESSSGNLGIALSLICAGTTGTIGGVSERLRQVFPSIKVIAVEPFGSVTFGGEAGKRDIPGIGTSVRPKLADLTNPDRVVEISEARTVETCLSFVRDHHLLVGGSTGTVLAAVVELAPEFAPGDTVVAISADLGDKYLDTIYDRAWVEHVITPRGREAKHARPVAAE